jgi:hypothetical protein
MTIVLAELMETNFETAVFITAALDHRKKHQLISSLAGYKLRANQTLLKKLTQFLADCKGKPARWDWASSPCKAVST